jgi:serine/threonine protein kinase
MVTPQLSEDRPFPRSSIVEVPEIASRVLRAEDAEHTRSGGQLEQLGKYHLIALLAHGGMADVYLGIAKGLIGFKKLLVVKELRHDVLDDEIHVTMFLNEARVAARLNHPNVVQTIEVGQEGSRRFIAMEYLDGQPLSRLLLRARRRGASMDPTMHLRVIADVLTALAYAHSLADFDGAPLGIVHRDVSPQNVFVSYDGNVKLIDFGVAKSNSDFSQQTLSGMLKGKLRYMAPEQTTRKPVDRRADIFAAGVMLWEAAAGRSPWDGGEDVTVLRSLMSGSVPRLRTARPDVHPALASIVDRAMSADPRARYRDALALRDELEGYLNAYACPPGNARALSEFASALFAEDRRQLRALVQGQLSLLNTDLAGEASQSGLRMRTPTSARGAVDRSSDNPPVVQFTVPMVEAARAIEPERTAPSKTAVRGPALRARRWLLVGMVAAIFFAVLIVGTKHRAKTRDGLRVVSPTAATATTSLREMLTATTAAPPPPAAGIDAARVDLVDLVVRVSPPIARVTIDGTPVENPYAASFPKDSGVHRIEARAPGYESKSEDVSFTSDTLVDLGLVRQAISASPARPAGQVGTLAGAQSRSAPTSSGQKVGPAASAPRRVVVKDPYVLF